MQASPGAATKTSPKNKNSKKRFENVCFVRSPWALLGVHLGWSIFFGTKWVLRWISKNVQKTI